MGQVTTQILSRQTGGMSSIGTLAHMEIRVWQLGCVMNGYSRQNRENDSLRRGRRELQGNRHHRKSAGRRRPSKGDLRPSSACRYISVAQQSRSAAMLWRVAFAYWLAPRVDSNTAAVRTLGTSLTPLIRRVCDSPVHNDPTVPAVAPPSFPHMCCRINLLPDSNKGVYGYQSIRGSAGYRGPGV
jgi:hypothetical protein